MKVLPVITFFLVMQFLESCLMTVGLELLAYFLEHSAPFSLVHFYLHDSDILLAISS